MPVNWFIRDAAQSRIAPRLLDCACMDQNYRDCEVRKVAFYKYTKHHQSALIHRHIPWALCLLISALTLLKLMVNESESSGSVKSLFSPPRRLMLVVP